MLSHSEFAFVRPSRRPPGQNVSSIATWPRAMGFDSISKSYRICIEDEFRDLGSLHCNDVAWDRLQTLVLL